MPGNLARNLHSFPRKALRPAHPVDHRPRRQFLSIYIYLGMYQMKNQKGFTLIELMIVVAIIAILAAIALPAYSNYTKKAKVSEVILAASSVRTDLSEYVASRNELPGDDWTPDFRPTQYVKSLEWKDGAITATAQGISDDINDDTITLTPDDSDVENGVIGSWTCEGTIDPKYRPGSCQGAPTAPSNP